MCRRALPSVTLCRTVKNCRVSSGNHALVTSQNVGDIVFLLSVYVGGKKTEVHRKELINVMQTLSTLEIYPVRTTV
jgi:hypothetical protein